MGLDPLLALYSSTFNTFRIYLSNIRKAFGIYYDAYDALAFPYLEPM